MIPPLSLEMRRLTAKDLAHFRFMLRELFQMEQETTREPPGTHPDPARMDTASPNHWLVLRGAREPEVRHGWHVVANSKSRIRIRIASRRNGPGSVTGRSKHS